MDSKNPEQDFVGAYNNIVRHLEFFRDLVVSLAALKDKFIKACAENDNDSASAVVIAMHIQISASIMSGIVNYPGILDEKIKVFEFLIGPGSLDYFDPSRN